MWCSWVARRQEVGGMELGSWLVGECGGWWFGGCGCAGCFFKVVQGATSAVWTAACRRLAWWTYNVEEEEAETRCQDIESVRPTLREHWKMRKDADDCLPINRKVAECQKAMYLLITPSSGCQGVRDDRQRSSVGRCRHISCCSSTAVALRVRIHVVQPHCSCRCTIAYTPKVLLPVLSAADCR